MDVDEKLLFWEKPVLFEEVTFHEALTVAESDFLELTTRGISELHIAWLLEKSLQQVRLLAESLSRKLGTDDLAAAAALLRDRAELNPISIGARLAEANARILTGARILFPVVEGDHCGLKVLLADGTPLTAWIYAKEDMDWPGWLKLQHQGDTDLVHGEDIARLLSSVKAALEGRPNSRGIAITLLKDIAEKAISIMDEIYGDPDLEPEDDNEAELDEWVNPPTLDPAYQLPVRLVERVEQRPVIPVEPVTLPDSYYQPTIIKYKEDPLYPRPARTSGIHLIPNLPPGPYSPAIKKMIDAYDDYVETAHTLEEGWHGGAMWDYAEVLLQDLREKCLFDQQSAEVFNVILRAYSAILTQFYPEAKPYEVNPI